MTIRELEQKSGLERANIRFYEKEKLLNPVRRENGYRDYSEEDLQTLRRICLFRRLQFSLEEIRSLQDGSSGDTASKAGETRMGDGTRQRGVPLHAAGQGRI